VSVSAVSGIVGIGGPMLTVPLTARWDLVYQCRLPVAARIVTYRCGMRASAATEI